MKLTYQIEPMEQNTNFQLVRCGQCGSVNRVRGPQTAGTRLPASVPICGRCKLPLTTDSESMAEPLIVTDASFAAEVLQAPLPVLLDLWAPWCGPCRMVAPTLEALAKELAGRIRIAKLNVDENPVTAAQLRVSSIPTLIIFNQGHEQDRLLGAQPRPVILQGLNSYL